METRFLVESILPVHSVPSNIRSRPSLRTASGSLAGIDTVQRRCNETNVSVIGQVERHECLIVSHF